MERNKKIIQTSLIAILANFLLVGIKGIIGLISGSIAILMDAVNNLSDALSSVITIIGTKIAVKSPDEKHPYGYGRIEYITSITIAVIILLAGISSFMESFRSIREGTEATYSTISLLAIVIAVAIKLVLGRFVKIRGQKYNSESLIASGTDALFDSVISASTLVAALVSIVFHISIEGYLGIIIAIVVVKAGVEILMNSIGSIVGNRVDSELTTKLRESIQNYAEVKGVYDLILHQYGPEKFIGSVHIEVDDELRAKEIHKLTRLITTDIYTNYGIVITVGIYASNTETNEFVQIKNYITQLTADNPKILQIHGFYVESETKTISFDIVINFSVEDASLLKDQLLKKLEIKYPGYRFYLVLDMNYSNLI
ncbi:cobalt-zinc-cadmium resistance protein [Lachnospiraceae bacterium KM106-2]|nr:cobalt-zinc-cadmium resistance protein [Lachnospiraceae bacterium KM106-2]